MLPDDSIEPGDRDRRGRMYADHDAYEQAQERQVDDATLKASMKAAMKELGLKDILDGINRSSSTTISRNPIETRALIWSKTNE